MGLRDPVISPSGLTKNICNTKMSSKKGRPLDSPLVRDQVVTVRLNSKEFTAIESYCYRYDVSISETIRQSLMVLSVIPENPKSN